jgi:hypothetical protein
VVLILCGIGILLGTLLPGLSFGEVGPSLGLVDHSVRVVNLDNDLLTAIIRQWNDEVWNESFRIYTWHAIKTRFTNRWQDIIMLKEGWCILSSFLLLPTKHTMQCLTMEDYGKIRSPVGDKSYENRESLDLIFTFTSSTVPRLLTVYPASIHCSESPRGCTSIFSSMSTGEAYQHSTPG